MKNRQAPAKEDMTFRGKESEKLDEVARTPHVTKEMEELYVVTERLESNFKLLYERMAGVLHDRPKPEPTNTVKVDEYLVPLASELRSVSVRLNDVAQDMVRLLQEIEL